MTTDYKNLTAFEASAVAMIAMGIALVAIQVFIALPQDARDNVASAMQVFEMSDAIAEVWEVEQSVDLYVFGGMEDFYHEFYVAVSEMVKPVSDDVAQIASDFTSVANAIGQVSDSIALNYEDNYVTSGVEADMGGRVMGAYFEMLTNPR